MDFKIDNDIGIGELSPGSVGRRFEPPGGTKKHNERIHRESKFADDHKNLPFTFSKPKKPGRQAVFECVKCGYKTRSSVNTFGIVCPECNDFVRVREVDTSG